MMFDSDIISSGKAKDGGSFFSCILIDSPDLLGIGIFSKLDVCSYIIVHIFDRNEGYVGTVMSFPYNSKTK